MRRRITLYLGGLTADLQDDGLVLLNWAINDLTNPAVVRNSWTQGVDLPRTPANDQIFGHSGRLDRLAGTGGTGPDFNASRRLPFQIYTETSEILFSGYAKLDAVTVDAYRVTLFGGLGELLYNLAFDSNGDKLTLADLDYGAELDFTINAQNVSDAWARLDGDTTKPEKWDIINFAPAYNGIPSDFQADKAVAVPSDVGLTAPIGTHDVKNGYCLVNLAQPCDEWAAKDLRSYLQRPVLSVRKLLEAIADPNNNGGWTVDLTDLASVQQLDTWLTRGLLPSLGTFKQTEGDIAVSFQLVSLGKVVCQYNCSDIPAGSQVTARLSFDLGYTCSAAGTMKSWKAVMVQNVMPGYVQQVLFVQAVAYASDNTMVAAGPVKTICKSFDKIQPSILAAACGYTPQMGASFASGEPDDYYVPDNGVKVRQTPITCEVEGIDIDYIQVEVTAYRVWITDAGAISNISGGTSARAALWDASDNEEVPSASGAVSGSGTATAQSAGALRSGALITQQMLLSTSKTPADYLLALCKMLGLVIVADGATRTAAIMRRSTFYLNEVTDLTGRVDRPSVEIQPLAFDSKLYVLRQEGVGGRFEKEYQETEGVQYGIQRIDTGYDFDASEKDLLSGSALKQAAAVCDRSRYWFTIEDAGSQFIPSVFLDQGNTYTLWDTDGEALDTEITPPDDLATATALNNRFPGYDPATSRAEFRDAENKPIAGADVLLFFLGCYNIPHFRITDDVAAMDVFVGGPCWILGEDAGGTDVPVFSRYTWYDQPGQAYGAMLDFGWPRQFDIPEPDIKGPTIYEAAWRFFFEDRLSVHGKVLKARLRLDGLQVGPELFRRFYFYDGTIWALSKISNHSLTTYDLTECEFVQVRDINNYLTQL